MRKKALAKSGPSQLQAAFAVTRGATCELYDFLKK